MELDHLIYHTLGLRKVVATKIEHSRASSHKKLGYHLKISK